MSKTEQIEKCMNIAFNHASSEAEATTAFKAARRRLSQNLLIVFLFLIKFLTGLTIEMY
jgi:uncharacterized protein (DUF1919 family)